MTEEQINEVMWLADMIENLAWSAGKTEQYNDNPVDYAEKLPAARAELEACLRTIGKPESVNAELLDAQRYRLLRDEDAWGEDTAPDGESAWAWLGELHGSEFDAFVDSRAKSAIETPDKVSPCAGHAAQQEADKQRRVCWSCKAITSVLAISEADGNCPFCGVEICQQEADEAGGA